MKKALLIDANALIHRAWHALPPMTSPSGKAVNAAYGFASVLIKVLASERPDVLAVCWDTPEPTFRHVKLETYKAQREEQPEEFYDQIPDAKDVVDAVSAKLDTVSAALPEGMVLKPIYQRTDLVNEAVGTATAALVEGSILVAVVLFLFLGELRSALVVIVALPQISRKREEAFLEVD